MVIPADSTIHKALDMVDTTRAVVRREVGGDKERKKEGEEVGAGAEGEGATEGALVFGD